MAEYLFVLGRDAELALLELESFFSSESVRKHKGNFVIVETDDEFDVEDFGGITKIGVSINGFDELVFDRNKLTYSFYGEDRLFLELKKRFKEEKIKASFRKFELSPRNLDFEIVEFDNKLFLIKEVSKPKKYKMRDEVRPSFDAKKVISIRLAKMMINFSKAEREILDPFCGNGTILQEGVLKGLDVIGVDMKINPAKKNLKWLKKNIPFTANYKLIEGDAKKISSYITKAECCVTEPYMGPYFTKLPSTSKAKRIVRVLMELYGGMFRELEKVVEKRVVMIVPSIRTYSKNITMDFSSILESHGFRLVKSGLVELPISYNMPKAKVLREIWVMEKFK